MTHMYPPPNASHVSSSVFLYVGASPPFPSFALAGSFLATWGSLFFFFRLLFPLCPCHLCTFKFVYVQVLPSPLLGPSSPRGGLQSASFFCVPAPLDVLFFLFSLAICVCSSSPLALLFSPWSLARVSRVSKETQCPCKRDLLLKEKRPTIEAKETQYPCKRDLFQVLPCALVQSFVSWNVLLPHPVSFTWHGI